MIQGVSPQIESILAAGNHAFSNLNCQPWCFRVKGEHIEIHIEPESDQSPYNTGQRLSYFTAGGVLENIVIAASTVGYRATVSYFPAGVPTHVATCELTRESAIQPDALEPEIFLRITNRKNFLPVKMSDKEKLDLMNTLGIDNAVRLKLIDERKDVKQLAEIAARDDELIFSNKTLHDFFFSHINWRTREDEERRVGLHSKTLELSPLTLAMYYVLQNSQVLEPFAQLGIGKFVSALNKSIYGTASAIGGITIPSDGPQNFILAGRAFERLWLAVTKVGLSMQPLNGIPYLKFAVETGQAHDFSPQQSTLIESGYADAQKIFGAEGKPLACMFRIGGGATPSGHSSRRELSQVVTAV